MAFNPDLKRLEVAINGLTKRVGAVEDQLVKVTGLLQEISTQLKTKGSEDKK